MMNKRNLKEYEEGCDGESLGLGEEAADDTNGSEYHHDEG